jgi:DNA-binding MarR family transcriptional regulator
MEKEEFYTANYQDFTDTVKRSWVGSPTGKIPIRLIDFWGLIDSTVFAVSRLREMELDQIGLTLAQSIMLNVLHVSGRPMTLEEITRNGMRQRHSISTLINRMANIGLVNKVRDPEDKKYKISISEEGECLRSRAGSDSFKMVFSILSTQEKHLLAAGLETLLDRARYLLGKSQVSPFLRHLNQYKEELVLPKKDETEAGINDTQLWVLLDQVGFAVSRLREMELARFGLTVPQAFILHAVVSRGGKMTLQELEEKRMRRYHTIFVIINRMIKLGLIVQEKSSQDKKYRIIITEEGQELVSRLTNDSLEMTFSVLTVKDIQQMGVIMEKLLERARYLLGVPHISPFLHHLIYGETRSEE